METIVERIRRFNRFYLPEFELLGNNYLGSGYSAAEARVIFEVYRNDGCNAASIARTMRLDKGYLSRVIAGHIKRGYLYRLPSGTDSRAYELHLTREGRELAEEFIADSNEQIAEKIQMLSARDCARLAAAFDTITELLEGRHEDSTV